MTGLVVDASVAIKWLVDEAGSADAIALLDHPIYAPDLLFAECGNILWKKVVRGELGLQLAAPMARALQLAEVAIYSTRELLEAALQLACRLRHPVYDCVYLALAQRLDLPLVTADRRLIAAVHALPADALSRLVIALSEARRSL